MGEHADLTLWMLVDVGPGLASEWLSPEPVWSPAILPAVQGVVRFRDRRRAAIRCQRPPPGRAIPRANVDRLQATPSYARRLSRLVKCPLSDTEPRPAMPGR